MGKVGAIVPPPGTDVLGTELTEGATDSDGCRDGSNEGCTLKLGAALG